MGEVRRDGYPSSDESVGDLPPVPPGPAPGALLTGAYSKNTRLATVEKGTRYASVTNVLHKLALQRSDLRLLATRAAMDQCVWAYEKEFGPVDWELAQFSITHLTLQVVVELRVEPV